MSDLLTAVQVALRENPGHPIPPITDPLGKYWDQPSRFDIEMDETHAVMSQRTFEKLAEYSTSQPTGVYPGKMWKCRRPWMTTVPGRWFLCWYGKIFMHESDGECVENHYREILIV